MEDLKKRRQKLEEKEKSKDEGIKRQIKIYFKKEQRK